MNILILEDTNTFVEEFVDILKNNNLFTDAHFFCLGDHFEEIDNTKDYQVIFIDVHLSKSINGIDFSIELKKSFPKALIVFVTMNNNFVHKSMELQPFYFIRKDHLNEDMSIFFKMFKEHLENTSFIVINAREKRVRINTSDIIYIEADGHYLKIITLKGILHITYWIINVSSAVSAVSPSTVATAFPIPRGPFCFMISHSMRRRSPGTTFLLNLALFIAPKYAVFPLFSSSESIATAPTCAHA